MVSKNIKSYCVNYLSILLFLLLFNGCIGSQTGEFEITRFEQDLFSDNLREANKLSYLEDKYPVFFPLFCTDIIGVGPVSAGNFDASIGQFINDPVIIRVFEMADSIYKDFNPYSREIKSGLNRFNKMIDKDDTIRIITYISGFNQSFISLPNILGIGLDNYLGSEVEFYENLAIPKYIRQTMEPENIVIDAVRAWILSEFVQGSEATTLLDNMLYKGKILYLLKESLPKEKEHKIFRYDIDQLNWCLQYEESMWKYIIEKELLYSTDRILISRMTKEAPFVREFGQESSGRAGSWLGYRIVKSYMKKTGKTPLELMENIDSREILAESKYRPR